MSAASDISDDGLLSLSDPSPVELLNDQSDHPLLLVCEHAGQAIPEKLMGLGIDRADLDSHIGWDLGAEAVTRLLAKAFGAPAVLQRYSRLVIDCNRPPEAPDAVLEVSDGVEISGNQAVSENDLKARKHAIFDPFQAAVVNCCEQHPRRIVLSIHSFTPQLGGVDRPWDIGLLFRKDTRTSEKLSQYLQQDHPHLTIGMNQPYQIDDSSDWFVPHHGEARNLPHSLIEIRNDHIRTPEGQVEWANILGAGLRKLLLDA